MKSPQILTTLGHLGHNTENRALVNCISCTVGFFFSYRFKTTLKRRWWSLFGRWEQKKQKQDKFPEVKPSATAWDRKLCFCQWPTRKLLVWRWIVWSPVNRGAKPLLIAVHRNMFDPQYILRRWSVSLGEILQSGN